MEVRRDSAHDDHWMILSIMSACWMLEGVIDRERVARLDGDDDEVVAPLLLRVSSWNASVHRTPASRGVI